MQRYFFRVETSGQEKEALSSERSVLLKVSLLSNQS